MEAIWRVVRDRILKSYSVPTHVMGGSGRCPTPEPIYEMGKLNPSGYIYDYEPCWCEDCRGRYLHSQPAVEAVKPVSEKETASALKGLLGILEDTE